VNDKQSGGGQPGGGIPYIKSYTDQVVDVVVKLGGAIIFFLQDFLLEVKEQFTCWVEEGQWVAHAGWFCLVLVRREKCLVVPGWVFY
jgi:hypothetical protein